jgi:hypothetical protein
MCLIFYLLLHFFFKKITLTMLEFFFYIKKKDWYYPLSFFIYIIIRFNKKFISRKKISEHNRIHGSYCEIIYLNILLSLKFSIQCLVIVYIYYCKIILVFFIKYMYMIFYLCSKTHCKRLHVHSFCIEKKIFNPP